MGAEDGGSWLTLLTSPAFASLTIIKTKLGLYRKSTSGPHLPTLLPHHSKYSDSSEKIHLLQIGFLDRTWLCNKAVVAGLMPNFVSSTRLVPNLWLPPASELFSFFPFPVQNRI